MHSKSGKNEQLPTSLTGIGHCGWQTSWKQQKMKRQHFEKFFVPNWTFGEKIWKKFILQVMPFQEFFFLSD